MRLAKEIGATRIQTLCDFQLVASQFSDKFDAKNERMDAYLRVVQTLAKGFESFTLIKIPKSTNALADALAALSSTISVKRIDRPSIKLPKGLCTITELRDDGQAASEFNEDDEPIDNKHPNLKNKESTDPDWRGEIRLYIVNGDLPLEKWYARRLKAKAAHY